MKKLFLFIQLSLSVMMGFSQTNNITLSFAAQNSVTQSNVPLLSVWIRNITQGCDTTIYGAAPSVLLVNSLGLNETVNQGPASFALLTNIPNPFAGTTNIYVKVTRKVKLNLSLSNSQGKKIAAYDQDFQAGLHKFEISSPARQLLILNVSDGQTSTAVKLINLPQGGEKNGIIYAGTSEENTMNTFKSGATSGFVFHLGDQLTYEASADGYSNATISGTPMQSTSYTFQMTPYVAPDGYYVKGAVTAYAGLNANAQMKITYNEVGQTLDPALFELYLPVKAGAAGFTITRVAGAVNTTYGPVSGFGVVTAPGTDEPKLPFQRGPVSSTSTAVFTVPSDGFYHVVFDTQHKKVAIMKVVWGMIGGATPGGWGNDTFMTESAFSLSTMSYAISGLTLNNGDWKFRYSQGWKVDIDTTNSDPTKWVKVNTNMGGTIEALVPGGYNIMNSDPGIYTCDLTYNLGAGYTATLTRTGNIPPINYSTYLMGIIGDAYLKQDGTPAYWDENFGTSLPAVSGTDYTWTYNIYLFGGKEFKFRQGYDWSGKSIGYGDVTWAGTAASYFTNNGGNIHISTEGNYKLVLKIEAATETYNLTATKN
ncbi:MAG: hypothetical protein NT040_16550 [Bacteroidetes bacterium]|nr:hypothetical protein [Bacteroidota bacterium]